MLLSFLGPAAKCYWTLGANAEAVLSSCIFLGMLFGVLFFGHLSDQYGRKVGLTSSVVILATGGLASSFAPTFGWLVFLRTLVGFAVGGTPIAVTMYAEFVSSDGRGKSLLLMQSFWILGTLFVAGLAWNVLPYVDGWRLLLRYSAVPNVLLILGIPFLPESPHWLAAHGRLAEAKKVLLKIARTNGKEHVLDGHSVHEEVEEAAERKSPSNECTVLQSTRITFQEIFSKQLRKTSILLTLIWFVNAMTYYGLVLLTTALQTSSKQESCTSDDRPAFVNEDYLAVAICTVAEAPGMVVAALLIDSRGRKWSLRAGMILTALALLPIVASPPYGLQLSFLFISRASIMGAFSVLYVYTPEFLPTKVRSFGLALCNSCSRLGGLAAPYATVYLVDNGRTAEAILILTTLCMCAGAAAFALPFETRGRDLSQASWAANIEEDEEDALLSR